MFHIFYRPCTKVQCQPPCTSTIQTYEGEPKDRSQIAVVSATNGVTVTRSTMIHSVDGVGGRYYFNNTVDGSFIIKAAPGKHSLEIGMVKTGLGYR